MPSSHMASYLIAHSSLSALSVSHPGAGAGELCLF